MLTSFSNLSLCFVLIKQSDSPCPYQFSVDCWLCRELKEIVIHSEECITISLPVFSLNVNIISSKGPTKVHLYINRYFPEEKHHIDNEIYQSVPANDNTSVKSLKHSVPRASPSPEVSDLICRLPLPTLFYRLEAIHLGDLMRLCVHTEINIVLLSPQPFEVACTELQTIEKVNCSTNQLVFSQVNPIPRRTRLLNRKENSSWVYAYCQLVWMHCCSI